MKKIELEHIGIIKTPHLSIENMPIQPVGAMGIHGVIELDVQYIEGLKDIEGFSHIILLYFFHQIKGFKLSIKPFMDNKEHGIFATRSPSRPSSIGLSTVKLLRVEDNKIYFEGADMLNDTPLIDIKPFFRQADNRIDARCGWLDEKAEDMAVFTKSDSRFKN
jgi:tRNA-Thr(GGU) m(6)t(6)A37 methyltransferase TsaA